MTLKEWLEHESVSVPQFAAMIGRSAEAVRRYVSGQRIPDKDTMPVIFSKTAQRVTPNDFFNIDQREDEPAERCSPDPISARCESARTANCARCGDRVEDPRTASCVSVHCPLREKVAA